MCNSLQTKCLFSIFHGDPAYRFRRLYWLSMRNPELADMAGSNSATGNGFNGTGHRPLIWRDNHTFNRFLDGEQAHTSPKEKRIVVAVPIDLGLEVVRKCAPSLNRDRDSNGKRDVDRSRTLACGGSPRQ